MGGVSQPTPLSSIHGSSIISRRPFHKSARSTGTRLCTTFSSDRLDVNVTDFIEVDSGTQYCESRIAAGSSSFRVSSRIEETPIASEELSDLIISMENSFQNVPREELISRLRGSTISHTVRRDDRIPHQVAATVRATRSQREEHITPLTSFIIGNSMLREDAEIIYDNKTSSGDLSPILGAIDINIEYDDALRGSTPENRSIPELQLSPDLALPLRSRQHHLSLNERIERDKPGFIGELFVLSMLPEILIIDIQIFEANLTRLQ